MNCGLKTESYIKRSQWTTLAFSTPAFYAVPRSLLNFDKKLSYRRETARQLPTWRGLRLGPPAHSPIAPSGYTYAYGPIRKP